jgi:hypothetical protein
MSCTDMVTAAENLDNIGLCGTEQRNFVKFSILYVIV